jgi:hypothetical protein
MNGWKRNLEKDTLFLSASMLLLIELGHATVGR